MHPNSEIVPSAERLRRARIKADVEHVQAVCIAGCLYIVPNFLPITGADHQYSDACLPYRRSYP
jgi:hypothetical protein